MPSYKLPIGCNIDETLRGETSAPIFVGILTEKSIQSPYVLFELGARWGNPEKRFFAGVAHGFEVNSLKAPLSGLTTLNFGNDADVFDLLDQIEESTHFDRQNITAYKGIVDDLCALARIPNTQRIVNQMDSEIIESELELNKFEKNALAILLRCDRSAGVEELSDHLGMGAIDRQKLLLAFEKLTVKKLIGTAKRMGGKYPAGGMKFYKISPDGIQYCLTHNLQEKIEIPDINLGEEYPAVF